MSRVNGLQGQIRGDLIGSNEAEEIDVPTLSNSSSLKGRPMVTSFSFADSHRPLLPSILPFPNLLLLPISMFRFILSVIFLLYLCGLAINASRGIACRAGIDSNMNRRLATTTLYRRTVSS
jgi:hypothetical protein